jgi:hypothetical protein
MVIRVKVLRDPRRVVVVFRRGKASEENENTAPHQMARPSGTRRSRDAGGHRMLVPAKEGN